MRSKSGQTSKYVFTMVELMIVIAIIVLLAALLLPSLQKARDTAKRIKCTGNLRQLSLAWLNYCNAHNEWLPVYDSALWGIGSWWSTSKAWPEIMQAELSTAVYKSTWGAYIIRKNSYLSCPSFPKTADMGTFNPDYGMNRFGIGGNTVNGAPIYKKMTNVKLPTQLVGFGDSYIAWAPTLGSYTIEGSGAHFRHSNKANLLFCDGHVELKDRYFFNPPWGWWNKAPWGNP
ncbi:MAG: hypothetical protein A2X49_04275 [Lentisphaerae bacterium GWF2_52_8]|nr:MAG: hypothetical protein A2X49_04275 [Lentisphaerae bacterium GWF2_52_8]